MDFPLAGYIKIYGARQHNLKNIDVTIPKNKFVVITGVSGSGKSSLAFDTIYAEGQRRYVESLSPYARQFLEQLGKPDCDKITGLAPAIAIEPKTISHNPRSTVGTQTEIYDFLRLLFARIGVPYCPNCNMKLQKQTVNEMVDTIMKMPKNKIKILAPVVRGRTGIYDALFERYERLGFTKVRVDGKIYKLSNPPALSRYKKHAIELIVDELVNDDAERLSDSIAAALKESQGVVVVKNGKNEVFFSEHSACPKCGFNFPELEPRLFSFNSPYGSCPGCSGLGFKLIFDEKLIVPDDNLSIADGAIKPFKEPITTRTHRWKASWRSYYQEILDEVCRRNSIPITAPFKKLTREQKNIIFYGDGVFEGVINNLERRLKETDSDFVREEITRLYLTRSRCRDCSGARLKKEALSVKILDRNIYELSKMTILDLSKFIDGLDRLPQQELIIAKEVLKELKNRISFLIDVGLDYLTLDRESSTLSGGESQRIELARQIGSGLTGVIYVIDEPTIGLHPVDADNLLKTLKKLKELGNTLIVIEHDERTIREAEYIIDLGPGGGVNGGRIVASGKLDSILKSDTPTAKFLNRGVMMPGSKNRSSDKFLEVYGARQFNLKSINVKFPVGCFSVITGVSGSGKSTLLFEIIYKGVSKLLNKSKETPGEFDEIKGYRFFNKVVLVDSSPIGRTPRSNPATYTGVFTYIRELFASTVEARRRGFKPGRFSFNVKGGRCEACRGEGSIKYEMQFLPDVYVKCDVCNGKRYEPQTLEVTFKGKNIYDVLSMSVEEAVTFFSAQPEIHRILKILYDTGLGYITLGQPATTLSGGEAQRVKLAYELSKKEQGLNLYLLDEPTTGLHFMDVMKLVNILQKLVDKGNTVIVIEHNLELIKQADWIVDLGPYGGDRGGYLLYQGPLSGIKKIKNSFTAKFI